MQDFYINSNSQEESYDNSNIISNYSNITCDYGNITSNYSNITSNYSNITCHYSNITFEYEYYEKVQFIMYVVTCIITSVGLPLTLVAIYALYSQVRNNHVAPIYVINLLISDLIQLCCMIIRVVPPEVWVGYDIVVGIYFSALTASVGFMVCVALERYLVITCPLWYRFRRTIKISVVVCVLVWVPALVFFLILHFMFPIEVIRIICSVFLLLPLPLFIFFLGGVLKALSASISVPSDEKQRIIGVLVLVLLIYTLLFLPRIIFLLSEGEKKYKTLYNMSLMFLRLSPLADLTLYIFMRKGIIDKLLSSVCCCRMDSNDINSPSV